METNWMLHEMRWGRCTAFGWVGYIEGPHHNGHDFFFFFQNIRSNNERQYSSNWILKYILYYTCLIENSNSNGVRRYAHSYILIYKIRFEYIDTAEAWLGTIEIHVDYVLKRAYVNSKNTNPKISGSFGLRTQFSFCFCFQFSILSSFVWRSGLRFPIPSTSKAQKVMCFWHFINTNCSFSVPAQIACNGQNNLQYCSLVRIREFTGPSTINMQYRHSTFDTTTESYDMFWMLFLFSSKYKMVGSPYECLSN